MLAHLPWRNLAKNSAIATTNGNLTTKLHELGACEIKYSLTKHVIDRQYFNHVANRIRIFKKITKTRKSVIPVFITPVGLYNNEYARRIPRQVTGNDLFVQL